MAVVIPWPAGLPQRVSARQFQELPPFAVVVHKHDAGADKTFGSGETEGRAYAVTLDLTAAQCEILDAFYGGTLNQGQLGFFWVDPRTEAPDFFEIVEEPLYGEVSGDAWQARFLMRTAVPNILLGWTGGGRSQGSFGLGIGVRVTIRGESGSYGDILEVT